METLLRDLEKGSLGRRKHSCTDRKVGRNKLPWRAAPEGLSVWEVSVENELGPDTRCLAFLHLKTISIQHGSQAQGPVSLQSTAWLLEDGVSRGQSQLLLSQLRDLRA